MKKHLPVLLLSIFLIFISWETFAQTQTIINTTAGGGETFVVPPA
ncbi:hypothetical protein [Algoriphagus hitonicola]